MKRKLFFSASLTVLLIFCILLLYNSENNYAYPTPRLTDISSHPVYSGYKFDPSENIIYIGIQPLYLPTGLITEAMKRDTILRNRLAELGMQVRYYPFLKGDDANVFLIKGDIDAVVGGDMPTISAAILSDIIIPAIIQEGFTAIVAKRFMLINELRNKRIGYAFGSNAHYALLNALASEGVTEKNITLVPMDILQMPTALESKEIDAFSAWEPTPSIAVDQYRNNFIIHRSLSTGYLYFSKIFADKHKKALCEIVASEIRAIRWMRRNMNNLITASEWTIQASENLSGRKLRLTGKQMTQLALKDILGKTYDPIIPEYNITKNMRSEFHFLKSLGEIPDNASWEKLKYSFNQSIITKIIKHPKKYQLDRFEYE